jgi:hypothetical protein
VDVRGQPPLRFDGGEVLEVVAGKAAQVLDEPVEQRGEVQRVPGGAAIIVGVRVGGCSVLADPAVARQVSVTNIDGRKVLPSGAV